MRLRPIEREARVAVLTAVLLKIQRVELAEVVA